MKSIFNICIVLLAVSFAPLAAAQDADAIAPPTAIPMAPLTSSLQPAAKDPTKWARAAVTADLQVAAKAPSATDLVGRRVLAGLGSVAGERVAGDAGFMIASGGWLPQQGRISPTVMISPSGAGQVGLVGAF